MRRAAVTAAAACYLANCALGTAVGVRLLDTSGFRWVHHALYIGTSALSGAALAVTLAERRPGRTALGAALAPAAIPLALIPQVSARTPRHVRLALAAAPSYLAALVIAWR